MVETAKTGEANKQARDQSTIQFPYGDMSDAIAVAQGIMKCGGVPCDADQLAAALQQAPTSGNFRLKIATARTFGVIETKQGKYQLTDLGFAIVEKGRERAAKVEAFLKVPLYKRVYDEFRNKQLPPRPAALERAFEGFGVAPKQKVRARQAFDRSAQQAGFFDHGNRDRLVRPVGVGTISGVSEDNGNPDEDQTPDEPVERGGGDSGGGGGGKRTLHPFIQGLLDTLPEQGTLWTVEGRAAWLQAAAQNFTLIYKGEGKIDIHAVTTTQRPEKAA